MEDAFIRPEFKEIYSSQVPALHLLVNMGWAYLPPADALALRGGRHSAVILTDVLTDWLKRHNTFTRKGRRYEFSEGGIKDAVQELVNETPQRGLLQASERVYELLTLGTSLSETIDGDTSSHTLHYIDWQNPAENVYHVTEEFAVERVGSHEKRRPDIVLFVNGIPLVVIECKRPDQESRGEKSTAEAISQTLRNQQRDQIPTLFMYAQLLMAVSGNDALYGTTETPRGFWATWREEDDIEPEVRRLINTPLAEEVQAAMFGWRDDGPALRRYFDGLGERWATSQDLTLYAMLRPARLLGFIYQYVVYDNGQKKVARYQQYFAVKETLNRVAHLNAQGTRTGGVIWHTTGSGKSLTMVMLAKALALHPSIKNPRVVLVTDRVNLDNQIAGTFKACGKTVAQANDGAQLKRLVTGRLKSGDQRADVIATVIDKFEQVADAKITDDDPNVFVLVDESHRSQYGTMHAKMSRVFPNACYIGFTGTPLTKAEKSTARKFGDFIHKYPMRQAVQDEAVVPLLYEGRIVEQDADKEQLERWFERMTKNLSDEEKADLKRKMSRNEAVNATEQRIKEVAYNIAEHYQANHRGTGRKAQLATASKRDGVRYLKHLRDAGIEAELVISAPDTREGNREVYATETQEVKAFWQRVLERYGDEEKQTREVLASFRQPDGIEILVVVDKLLTGFDEPRNTVLYVDKPLKEHNLLQAIARVNRLHEKKDFGYIVDYRGVLGQLNEAMNLYDALADFDMEDVQGTVTDVSEEIKELPQRHSDLWAVFEGVANKGDREQLERHLEPEDRRQQFYEALTAFAKTLRVALSSASFYDSTPEARIRTYKDDLKFFHGLRQSVKLRYAEAVDYRDYEEKVRKVMDEHIRATGTSTITEMVNIFDAEKFDQEVARLETPTAKADTILNRMKRTISEHIDEDPAFYKHFSEMVAETIEAYRQGRIDQNEYLKQAQEHLDAMRSGKVSDQPERLSHYRHAHAYFGLLNGRFTGQGMDKASVADVAIQIEQIVENHKVTDWQTNQDVHSAIKADLDDYLYQLESDYGLSFTSEELDALLDQVLEIALARDRIN